MSAWEHYIKDVKMALNCSFNPCVHKLLHKYANRLTSHVEKMAELIASWLRFYRCSMWYKSCKLNGHRKYLGETDQFLAAPRPLLYCFLSIFVISPYPTFPSEVLTNGSNKSSRIKLSPLFYWLLSK